MKIKSIHGREILDSRGNPTVEVVMTLDDGSVGIASAPSGASTGKYEALEMHDGGERFNGRGVAKAISHVNEIINPLLQGQDASDQALIDQLMIDIDGTPNKSKLGANAILPVSLAASKAVAISQKIPLWKYLHRLSKTENAPDFPIPMFNIMNGGAHATNNIDIQEFMIIPQNIDDIEKRIEAGTEITSALKTLLHEKGIDVSVGDEGGFAPSPEDALNDDEDVLSFLVQAIEKAGYKPAEEIMIGLDIAISRYYDPATKKYKMPHQRAGVLEGDASVISAHIESLTVKYPIVLIEDGLAEDDWEGWQLLSSTLMERNVLCVGDDLTVTNPERVQKAIDLAAISAMIVKPNQIGSLTEVLEVLRLCEENQIVPMISHRSGDTEDPFVADLAYGVGARYLKSGAPVRSERLSKYNELLRIKNDLELKTDDTAN